MQGSRHGSARLPTIRHHIRRKIRLNWEEAPPFRSDRPYRDEQKNYNESRKNRKSRKRPPLSSEKGRRTGSQATARPLSERLWEKAHCESNNTPSRHSAISDALRDKKFDRKSVKRLSQNKKDQNVLYQHYINCSHFCQHDRYITKKLFVRQRIWNPSKYQSANTIFVFHCFPIGPI